MSLCAYCNRRVDEHSCYRRVIGWERPGRGMSGKTGSSLVLREAQREVACDSCITRLRTGMSVTQETLL